jgi:hypothetical protein
MLSTSFLRLVEQKLFSKPPCKTLGLHANNANRKRRDIPLDINEIPVIEEPLEFLERINEKNGIRINQLLRALKRQSRQIIFMGTQQAEDLREKVRTGHRIDDDWHERGWPTVFIILDNSERSEGLDFGFHILRDGLLNARAKREEWQCE